MSRRRYRVTFYVTEGPDEDGEMPDPYSIAVGIEDDLKYAWRQGPQSDDSMKLDSDVSVIEEKTS